MDANLLLTIGGGFLTGMVTALGGYKLAKANAKKTYADEKLTIIKGADQVVETVLKITERQDKIIDKQSKEIEIVREFYKSENNGLKENQNIMSKKIEDLQHTYNTSLTQDRTLLTELVKESKEVMKETNFLLKELKSKK